MSACFNDRFFARTSRGWIIGLLLGLTAVSSLAAERFSATLTATQRTEAGLTKLTDDNIAVIDALVRQDEAAPKRKQSSAVVIRGHFSERHSTHERAIAGLDQLTTEEVARLNELIARRTAASSPTLTAEIGSPSPPDLIRRAVVTREPALEVHGSITLTYGWSKAGDIRGGSMVVSVQDPAHRFTLLIGYSEYRGKGLAPYPYDPIDDEFRYRRPSPTSPDRSTLDR